MNPLTVIIPMLYTLVSAVIARHYITENSSAKRKTSDPFEHAIITLILLMIMATWPLLVPGWQINKEEVNNK